MGLRLETTIAAADRDVWHSLDPRLYRCKFAHRAFPAAPLEMAPLAPVDLAGMAQPQHVLGVIAPVVMARAGLAYHEGLEALPA